jgi:uncharacterized DUF497 family protein
MADRVGFDWDPANTEHIARHRVTPDEVEQAFANGETGIDYDVIGGEERWTVMGQTDQGARAHRRVHDAWPDGSYGDGLRGQ